MHYIYFPAKMSCPLPKLTELLRLCSKMSVNYVVIYKIRRDYSHGNVRSCAHALMRMWPAAVAMTDERVLHQEDRLRIHHSTSPVAQSALAWIIF